MGEVKYIVVFEPYGDMWEYYYGPFDTEEGARKSSMEKANEFCQGLKHGTVEVVSDNNPFQVEVLDKDKEEAHRWHIGFLFPVDKESYTEEVKQYIVTLTKDNQPDEYFGPFISEMAARVFMERAAKEQERVSKGQAFIKKNFAIVNMTQSENVWLVDVLNKH